MNRLLHNQTSTYLVFIVLNLAALTFPMWWPYVAAFFVGLWP